MARTPARPEKSSAPARKSSTAKSKSSASRSTTTKSAAKSKQAPAARRAPARPRAASRKPTPRSSGPVIHLPNLSTERKLDILGVFLALIGLLAGLSLLSVQRGAVTGFFLSLLRQGFGWGGFVIPLVFIGLGLWLVFRNLNSLPVISAERMTGLVLLSFNLLAWMHLLAGGGWQQAALGLGGGYVGGFFTWVLVSLLGTIGAIVVLIAWSIISLILTLDISLPELIARLQQGDSDAPTSSPRPAQAVFPRQATLAEAPAWEEDEEEEGDPTLPPDFQPLNAPLERKPAAPRTRTSTARAEKPASTKEEQPVTEAAQTSGDATMPIWMLPKVEEILDPPTAAAIQTNADVDRGRLIEETLASFGAPSHVVEIHHGPTVTQYGVEPDFVESRSGRTRVRVSKIAALADDLALALAAPRIRIQAPVPGRNYVGIEVANQEAARVAMREVLESTVFKRVKSPLRFALGKDVAGAPVVTDLAAMPHLLIAGTTGSGKSVCVNSVLCSLLLNNTPNELRLILVDPKRVELTGYNGVPHLMAPVITDAEKVTGALQWLQREMDARYHRFSQVGSRNIQDYNGKQSIKLPYIVAVIDELADLMMLAPDETERSITRLAQLARATGIHLIIATQRPSVDVVTGLIKANFPARVAFAVASGIDSRVILDQPGAERLLGRGDMLFQAPDAPAPARLQGVYVSDPEIQRLVDYWRTASASMHISTTPTASGEPVDMLPSGVPLRQVPLWEEGEDSNSDPLYSEAVALVRKEGRASITMLQRRMRIGYTRAARLIDSMEEKGVVGQPVGGSQVREVLDYGPTAPPEDDGY